MYAYQIDVTVGSTLFRSWFEYTNTQAWQAHYDVSGEQYSNRPSTALWDARSSPFLCLYIGIRGIWMLQYFYTHNSTDVRAHRASDSTSLTITDTTTHHTINYSHHGSNRITINFSNHCPNSITINFSHHSPNIIAYC